MKEMLNGAKLPNWVWLVVLGVSLGWFTCTAWLTSKFVVDQLGAKVEALQKVVATKADSADVVAVQGRLDDLQDQVDNIEGKSTTTEKRSRKIASIDDRLDQITTTLGQIQREKKR